LFNSGGVLASIACVRPVKLINEYDRWFAFPLVRLEEILKSAKGTIPIHPRWKLSFAISMVVIDDIRPKPCDISGGGKSLMSRPFKREFST
jgi:hypothetical protein